MDEIKTPKAPSFDAGCRACRLAEDMEIGKAGDLCEWHAGYFAALSRLAEPGEDALELAKEIEEEAFDPWHFDKTEKRYMGSFDRNEAAALIERYAAAQEAQAREESSAMIWMAERIIGVDAARSMQAWLDDYRKTGRLAVHDMADNEIEHYPEEAPDA